MKIATWNVNSLKVRLEHVLQWLEVNQPDVLVLQETKSTDENFPQEAIEAAGYHVVFAGQKTYNGVAVISKKPASDIVTDFPTLEDPQRRILGVTIEGVRILNLYIPNGSAVGSEKYAYKLNWLQHLTQYVQEQLKTYSKFVMLGDFNIAPADIDVHDPAKWQDAVLCSKPEREALVGLLDFGLIDVYRQLNPESGEFSWWDYRQAAFRRNLGMRIDLILANTAYAEECCEVIIDKLPRTLERPSDHTPVLATFN
jgi:exodeoxyribonuclease-3